MLFAKKKGVIDRILIVEDEPLVAFDNEHFLRECGFTVAATVDSVEAALAAIVQESIDLILLDLSLSDGGTGLDVARAAQTAAIPVLFVTGGCPDGARSLAIGCLAKPYAQRDLKTAIGVVDAVLQGQAVRRLPGGFSLFTEGAPSA